MTTLAAGQRAKAEKLRALHRDSALLNLVNVWDVASARTIAASSECAAIATASAAIAASHGYPDGEHIPWELHVGMLRRICSAVDLPVTADLERGYGNVRATVESAIDAGVVGANLEDDLCPTAEMQSRIDDAVAAGGSSGVPIVLNARTDVYLINPDWDEDAKLSETIGRGLAYLAAGADCVFVPGCTKETSIDALVGALGRERVSLLAVPGLPAVGWLEEAGVARLSHGPFPHRRTLEALAAYPHGV